MAVLIANWSIPTEQVKAWLNRAQEVMPKFPTPENVIVRGPYSVSDIEKGMRCLSIIEVDPSKILEERTRLAAFFNAFNGIPGYKFSIEIWVDQADAQARMEKYGF